MRQLFPPVVFPAGFSDVIPIGRGSQGLVFRATKSSIRKVVALKAFPLGPAGGIHERALRAEVRALVALSGHPGVVDVHDLHVCDGWAWLEMDYCGGGSSATWAAHRGGHRDGELCAAVPALLLLGGQVAEALQFAHQQGWVHGDVKPSNILLDDLATARLCDFGLARLAAAGVVVGTGFRAPGTPRFQPPEVIAGAARTAAGDVFALAETLRDLRRLLVPDTVAATARVRDPDVTDTSELGTSCAEVLADLEVLLAHMSDNDPGLRPRAGEVAERLAILGARVTGGEDAPSPSAPADLAAVRLEPGETATRPGPPATRPGLLGPGRVGRLRMVIAVAVASFLALLIDVFFQLLPAGQDGAAGPTTAPARSPVTGSSTRTQPAGAGTAPLPPPSDRNAPTTTTYHFPVNVLSPQFMEGSCVYRVLYGNFGKTPLAKVRFYSGDCGGAVLAVTAQRDGVTSYYGHTGGSTGTDSCGTYIELQADGRGVAATALGESLHFPSTGRGYAFVSGAGQPVKPYRYC